MKDRSDDPSHHERTLLPRSYISLLFISNRNLFDIPTSTTFKGKGKGRKEIIYLTTHSTHFIYGYMASGIWYRTTQIAFVIPVVDHWLEREIVMVKCLPQFCPVQLPIQTHPSHPDVGNPPGSQTNEQLSVKYKT